MTIGVYLLDGIRREYYSDGKTAYNPVTCTRIERVWAYPVKQGVWGGEPETLYFSSAELRDEYVKQHDHCDKLPRRKVPEI